MAGRKRAGEPLIESGYVVALQDVAPVDLSPAAKILGPELPLRPIADQFVWRSHKGGF